MENIVRTHKLTLANKSIIKVSKVALHVATALLLTTTGITQALAAESKIVLSQTHKIQLPAGNLGDAITELSLQTGVQILVASDLIKNEKSLALNGKYNAETALTVLVKSTGLVVQRSGNNALTLVVASNSLTRNTSSMDDPVENIEVYGSYTSTNTNSATGLNMSLRETPQAISVMTNVRMDDQNLHEISEVLEQAVGITYDGSPLGSDGNYFYSRGFAVTNYQLNGVPRPSGIYGFDVSTSDMTSYDRIEIVRGATGLMNGVGNPSASINFIRKQATESFNGGLSAQLGSWDHYRLEGDISGPLVESGRIRARLAASTQSDDTHVERIKLEKQAIYGVIEADLTEVTTLAVGFEYQSIENTGAPRGGLPLYFSDNTETNFARSTNNSAYWGKLTNGNTNLFLSLDHKFNDKWLLKVTAEHAEPEYDDTLGYMSSRGVNIDGSAATLYSARWSAELTQDFIGAAISGSFDWLGKEQEVVFGLTYSDSEDDGPNYCGWWCSEGDYRQTIDNSFEFMADGISGVNKPDFSSTGGSYGGAIKQTSAYGAMRLKPLDAISLVLGSRVTNWKEVDFSEDNGETTYADANEEKGVITPYMGVIADFNDYLSGYASFTQIFEPQNYEDINGKKLDPLEGNNSELGLKADLFDELFHTTLSVFRIEQDNYPVRVPDVIGPTGGSVYQPETGTVSKGFEIEVAGEILPGWQVVGGFSQAKVKDADGDVLLTTIPENNFKLFSSYQFDEFMLGGNIRWQGKAYIEDGGADWDSYYQQGSLVIFDLMAKYYFSDEIILQLNVNNILDEKYYSGFGYSVNYGKPRNITATVKWDF